MPIPRRRGRNLGRYFGRRIDIRRTLRGIATFARQHDWSVETLPVDAGVELLTLQRRAPGDRRRIYLSAGIHGDEPAGPLALHALLAENKWPDDADVWICPCLNPAGFESNTRENPHGIDLNRDYLNPRSREVRVHLDWLERQPDFDLALCLHEDWEARGFYVYELNAGDAPALAPRIVAAVAQVCPIDRSPEIDGRPARDGIINPTLDPAARPLWPEAFYLVQRHTRQCCTLEAPSDFALAVRAAALAAGVRAVLPRANG